MESTRYDRGERQRAHLRGGKNIFDRLVVRSGAANLGLLVRRIFGRDNAAGLAGALSVRDDSFEPVGELH